jgi:hypothetical protein
LLYAGLGYSFAGHWQLVSQTITRQGGWLGLCAITAIGIYLLLRRLYANHVRAAGEAMTQSP